MKTPFLLESDRVAFFDVDDTLILWAEDSQTGSHMLTDAMGGRVWVTPNLPVIQELKRHKARGHAVVVWSQGGYEWAKKAVDLLYLNSYVDVVACKPTWYWDDLPAQEWMGKRFYKVAKEWAHKLIGGKGDCES